MDCYSKCLIQKKKNQFKHYCSAIAIFKRGFSTESIWSYGLLFEQIVAYLETSATVCSSIYCFANDMTVEKNVIILRTRFYWHKEKKKQKSKEKNAYHPNHQLTKAM